MRIYVRLNIIIICVLTVIRVDAQDLINIRHYSTTDGLSDNKVISIIKDRDGFMWFSTWAGINRFDGYDFKAFKSYPGDESSLKSNRIDEIVEDKLAGFLWIKAYDNQVYRFDKRSQKFTALPDLLKDESLKKVQFKGILSVINNEVWLKSDDGIFLIQDALGSYPKYKKYALNQDADHLIPSNKVLFFHLDSLNQAWVGTKAGVSVLKPTTQCDYQAKKINELGNIAYSEITETEHFIWLAYESKVTLISKDLKICKSFKITNGNITNFKSSNKGNELFCTTSLGEIISIKENSEYALLGSTSDKSPLYSILETSDGNLWMESEHYGVALLKRKTNHLSELLPFKQYGFTAWSQNFTMFENKNHSVWIALNGYGLGFYDAVQEKMQKIVLESINGNKKLSNLILRSFYDPNGVLWLVSDYGGVEKIVFQDHNFTQHYVKPQSEVKIDNEVRGIYADNQSRLWVGTKAKELHVYKNGEELENPFIDKLNFPSGIYSIFKDSNGNMWFGTKKDGLFKAIPDPTKKAKFKLERHYFEKDVLKSNPGENSIYAFLEDSRGRIWAGSYGGGLILLENKGNSTVLTLENSFNNYPIGNFRRVRHLAEDGDGRIWIATTDGLLIFNPNKGNPKDYQFKLYKKRNGNIKSLGGNDVQFIFKDSKHRMWVLTSSGGLNLAEGKNPLDTLTFKNFSSKDGLPSDFLLSCTEDAQQNLWIASQNGISKFSTLTHKIQNFSHYDGLFEDASFSESSCTKMPDGSLIFGNTSGFLTFNPSEIHSNKIEANMVFTNIQINGEDIIPLEFDALKEEPTFAKDLKLAYNENIITIDFAVLDFHASDKQNYACRILGFDNVWRNTDHQTKVTYTKLPPGDYVFQVKSLNDEFYKDVPIRSLNLHISPPIWQTWWAYIIYLIVFISILILVQRVIITMLKLKHGIELEKKLADLKLNFFTQISHELRTPLTLIVNPMEEVLHNEKLTVRGKSYVKLALKNSLRMTRLINQVLDLKKVQSGKASRKSTEMELISFIENLISYFEETISKRNLQVKLICDLEELKAFWDADKMEIVIYNLLANAIKFSPNGGEVKVILKALKGNQCEIQVIDQGPGVLEEELQTIFNIYYEGKHQVDSVVKSSGIGLALAKELVILHEGEIFAENIPSSGLKVVLRIDRNLKQNLTVDEEKEDISPLFNKEEAIKNANSTINELGPESQIKEAISTVLIVEDNDDLRDFLEVKFTEFYNVVTAVDGEQGLDKAIEFIPDLILSDIMMPNMDGIQMLNKLKNNSLTSHIPVILLTAKNSVENHIKGLRYGADYYLPKPFDMNLLSTAINNILLKRNKFFHSMIENQDDISQNTEVIENIVVTSDDKIFLKKTIEIVKGQMENPDFNIDTAADLMNMSRSAFFKKFKSLTDLAPVEFVRDTRLEKGKELLEAGSKNVSEVAYAIGFNNPKYFSTCFKAKFHVSPSDYLKKNL